ncbi:hypothetical protein TNCV_4169391 [Trichonephila clavipes]|nr:hypothetical protein TNCV_4169391 [Trichonephila clavipes]
MLVRVWKEMEYRLDICHVTKNTVLNLCKIPTLCKSMELNKEQHGYMYVSMTARGNSQLYISNARTSPSATRAHGNTTPHAHVEEQLRFPSVA